MNGWFKRDIKDTLSRGEQLGGIVDVRLWGTGWAAPRFVVFSGWFPLKPFFYTVVRCVFFNLIHAKSFITDLFHRHDTWEVLSHFHFFLHTNFEEPNTSRVGTWDIRQHAKDAEACEACERYSWWAHSEWVPPLLWNFKASYAEGLETMQLYVEKWETKTEAVVWHLPKKWCHIHLQFE